MQEKLDSLSRIFSVSKDYLESLSIIQCVINLYLKINLCLCPLPRSYTNCIPFCIHFVTKEYFFFMGRFVLSHLLC